MICTIWRWIDTSNHDDFAKLCFRNERVS